MQSVIPVLYIKWKMVCTISVLIFLPY